MCEERQTEGAGKNAEEVDHALVRLERVAEGGETVVEDDAHDGTVKDRLLARERLDVLQSRVRLAGLLAREERDVDLGRPLWFAVFAQHDLVHLHRT